MLVQHNRLRLNMDVHAWVDAALTRPGIELLPFSSAAALRAAGLGAGFPGDPADRFIVATALEAGAPLLTSDQAIARWGGIDVVW
jgi:PIN domain nuclease of toxin-antitoxin system